MKWTTRIAAATCIAALIFTLGCDSGLVPAGSSDGTDLSVAAKSPRIDHPADDPGPPFFFNALNPVPFANPYHGYPEWMPVFFYRPVDCLPPDLDLLNPGIDPRAFGCPLTLEGFYHFPEGAMMPTLTVDKAGTEVPFWFVRLDEWLEAAGDGHVWLEEFKALPSFREGYAEFYSANQDMHGSTIQAHGVVTSEPGMRFKLHFVAQFVWSDTGQIQEENIPVFEVDFQ